MPGGEPPAAGEAGTAPALVQEARMPISAAARPRLAVRLGAAALLGLAAACAPPTTNTTVGVGAMGVQGYATYGTIVQMRPVRMAGTRSGAGAAIGAGAGGLVGSTIGQGWRERTVAGVGGALIGGLAGAAIEEGATGGVGYEFIIQEDGRPTPITVNQTNEEGLRPGERVVITRTDRVRIARAVGAPPPPAYGYGAAVK
jgi:outer membrane lipoprotein SlyB